MKSSLLLLLLACGRGVFCSRSNLTATSSSSQGLNIRSPKSEDGIGCAPTNVSTYNGNASTTESGRTCEVWAKTTWTGDPVGNLTHVGNHNFCRSPAYTTPDGNWAELYLWCFTTDPEKLWEYCNVPVCKNYTKGKRHCACTTGHCTGGPYKAMKDCLYGYYYDVYVFFPSHYCIFQ